MMIRSGLFLLAWFLLVGIGYVIHHLIWCIG